TLQAAAGVGFTHYASAPATATTARGHGTESEPPCDSKLHATAVRRVFDVRVLALLPGHNHKEGHMATNRKPPVLTLHQGDAQRTFTPTAPMPGDILLCEARDLAADHMRRRLPRVPVDDPLRTETVALAHGRM